MARMQRLRVGMGLIGRWSISGETRQDMWGRGRGCVGCHWSSKGALLSKRGDLARQVGRG